MVLWIDNWYRPWYTTDPQCEDASLNVSVMAVLPTTSTRPFQGHWNLGQLLDHAAPIAASAVSRHQKLLDGVSSVFDEHIDSFDIRVPLDVQRSRMRSLPWKPFMLTNLSVSSQGELIQGYLFTLL